MLFNFEDFFYFDVLCGLTKKKSFSPGILKAQKMTRAYLAVQKIGTEGIFCPKEKRINCTAGSANAGNFVILYQQK